MGVGRRALGVGIMASLAACALFTDTSGFSDGQAPTGPDAATEAADVAVVTDAGDASSEAAPVDAGMEAATFRDEFARGDSLDLGNGWIEKTPTTFQLLAGVVAKDDTGSDYQNNLVYRPVAEDAADVEVAATFTAGTDNAFPQVFARAIRSTIATPDAYDAYIFFLSTTTTAVIARQRGVGSETDLATIPLSTTISAGMRVRLTLRTSGSNPVALEGLVDLLDTTTTRIGQVTTEDSTTSRLSDPGATGFSAAQPALPGVDDFEWRALP